MHLKVVEHIAANPQLTQDFLGRLDGVVEATVWAVGEKLLARVTVNDWSLLSDTDMRQACRKKLGAAQTPALIMIERVVGERAKSAA